MYTGIVETTGRIARIDHLDGGCRLRIDLDPGEIDPGDSVAISGVCLTAEAVHDDGIEAFCSTETADRTYLADCDPGDRVNVERPVAAGGRFDGHVVTGTVDTHTEVRAVEDLGEDWRFTVALPSGYEGYVIEKGSVTVDGISLSVAGVDDEAGTFSVAVVPETYERTTLSDTTPGDRVHFEADVLAKYVERRRAVAEGT